MRIHQLASEWGVASKDVLERLEKMGIKGKKAQSSLTDAEAERVRAAMGISSRPTEPHVVTRRTIEHGALGPAETVVTETHIKPGMVLRRTKRSGPAEGGGMVLSIVRKEDRSLGVVTAIDIPPAEIDSFNPSEFAYATMPVHNGSGGAAVALAVAEPAAVPVEPEPVVAPPTPTSPEPPLAADAAPVEAKEAHVVEAPAPVVEQPTPEPPPAPVDEFEDEEFEPTPVDEPDKLAAELLSHAEAKEDEERAGKLERKAGPRVLGRIDLSQKPKPATAEAGAKPGEEKPAGEADKPGRKKKRKVVRKEDMFDAFERSFQARQRRPIKRRVAPGQRVQKTELTVPKASKRVVKINEVTTAGELAKAMGIKAGEVLGSLMKLGVMKSINDAIDFDSATLVAEEFGYTVENTAVTVEDLLQGGADVAEEDQDLEPRPPVVTVMGHVDHGKTSLLDVIRKSNVVASESGGITQHIGAYLVSTPAGEVCFLDTPGHAAFTAMRARGASVTDIVILVVAADDGVMPQTIEAIDHAKAAGIPVVVAVNKMDKPDANPDRVMQQLSEHGLQPEQWGGDTQFVPVSAIKKTGIDDLLEAVSLQAQILELTAVADRPAHGVVIESRLDKGRGPVATLLVQQGTLRRGDHFVVGEVTGRVRAMMDHTGEQIEEAGPSHAVEILGLDSVPEAGDVFDVVEDASRAAQVADHRRQAVRKAQAASSARMSLEDLQAQIAAGEVSELKVIIKADVHGSAEALKVSLEKLSTDEVALNVIHQGVGAINESDVQLALASQAIIVGFHVRPEGKARQLAEREGVDIRLHTIIYEAIDEMKAALEGMLAPEYKEQVDGRAEVRDTFNVPGGMTVAGCYVTEGKIVRNGQCRLLRDNVVVHTGTIASLRRFKDDVREVQTSYECGIGIERFNDVKPGDVIECFRMEAIKRTLDDRAASPA